MQSLRIAGCALVAATLMGGCSEPNKPTEGAGTRSPKSNFSNAPSQSGLRVVRGTSFFFFVVFDADHGMAAAINGRDGIANCGEPFTVSQPGRFQDVLNPSDEILVQELFKADAAFVHVYAWDGVPPPDDDAFCALLTGPRIARGRARLVSTDNDFFAFLRSMPIRADAFGFTAQGTVNLTAGGTARFNAVDRVVFFPPDQVKETARIGLR